MRLKPVSLLASLGIGVLLSTSARAYEPIAADCGDPCPVVNCAPAPCIRILPSLCEVLKRRVCDPVCIERPPLFSRLHRNVTCMPSGAGYLQSVASDPQSVPSTPNKGNAQSTPSNPAPAAPAQGFAQAAVPSMVTVPVQSFVMVPVTTWQAVPVTTYQTVSANSMLAQSFNGVQTASGQSFGSSALSELETRLSQIIRANGGSASAQAAGTTPCAKTQAELDRRFLELEKRLTDLQLEASKVLVKHDGQLEEINKTMKLLLQAGKDQNSRIEKLEKPMGKPPEPMKKSDVIPTIPVPMPESK